MQDFVGRAVTEEEVATALGFESVIEMRRWETEMGQKVASLEQSLRSAVEERDLFLWQGKRMMVVLERMAGYLATLDDQSEAVSDLRLAIGVVKGEAVDWHHRLKGWFSE